MKKIAIKSKWISLNEGTNSLDYLERAYQFIKETETDPIAWKWVILSLHGALYGFAICACKGTSNNSVTIQTKRGRKKLIFFDDALVMCQDPQIMQMYFHSKHLVISDRQKESIKYLKQTLRNNFEHYIPRLWSIEIHGMPQVCIDVLDVIRFLAIDTHNYIHFNQSQIRKIKSLVYQSKKLLKKSTLFKELQIASELY
ncbi:hypothetical protein JXJ21_18240 [candidate division KSB1 bacterium]|nr:hypothetical protein [candidate division KSB1 bacterium]